MLFKLIHTFQTCIGLFLKSVAFFIEHSIAYMETVSPSNFLRIIKKASVSEILGD